jgi:hypothetical protein
MKKTFLSLLSALAIAICGVFALGVPAQAAVSPTTTAVVQTSASVVKPSASFSAPGGVAKSAPSFAGGGVKPSWYYLPWNYCYWAMNGGYYCYRYGCTQFEIWLQGCYDGYVRQNVYTWV